MKKTLKMLSLLLIALILISTISVGVNADTAAEDVAITITTDKTSYSATDTANVSVTVENKSGEDLKNTVIYVDADNWMLAKGNNSNILETGKLEKNEAVTLTFSCVVNRKAKGLGLFDKIILFFVQIFSRPSEFKDIGSVGGSCVKASKVVSHGGVKVNINASCYYVLRPDDYTLLAMYNDSILNVIKTAKSFSKNRTTNINNLDGGAFLEIATVKEYIGNIFGAGSKDFSFKNGNELLITGANLSVSDVTDIDFSQKSGNYIIELVLKNGSGNADGSLNNESASIIKTGLIYGEETDNDYDYKSAKNYYEVFNSIEEISTESVKETTENCRVCATIDSKTGKMINLVIGFDFTVVATDFKYLIAKASKINCDGSTVITYSDFKY